MKFRVNNFAIILSCAIFFTGCRVLNPSVMLKTKADYKYSEFPPSQSLQYHIAPNDQLSFKIFSNDGFKMIDFTSIASNTQNYVQSLSYKVEFDGTIKLPLIGRTKLQGMTVREAESFLEDKYSAFYNKPYVLMDVTNRRVIIFPGSEGAAKVVQLSNENTTLLEALAQAGGIASSGKAYKVKLIRGDLKKPDVYLIDLSTLDGMKHADLVIQANDIIYIEPQIRIGHEVMGEILPYLSFVTTMIAFYAFITRTK